jgi:hypothetical protein
MVQNKQLVKTIPSATSTHLPSKSVQLVYDAGMRLHVKQRLPGAF